MAARRESAVLYEEINDFSRVKILVQEPFDHNLPPG